MSSFTVFNNGKAAAGVLSVGYPLYATTSQNFRGYSECQGHGKLSYGRPFVEEWW